MTKDELFTLLEIEDIRLLPEALMKLLELNIVQRNEVYTKLLRLNNNDLSYDWFQSIYEDELAQRKQSKQDFTPNSVSLITSLLTGNHTGIIHEPTAGNGSMIITDWWNRCLKQIPWNHYPSDNMVNCWELSDRSIPILLFNLSIRGIMGYVYHGDVLEKTVKAKYILLNRNNDTLEFSEVIKDTGNFKITKI